MRGAAGGAGRRCPGAAGLPPWGAAQAGACRGAGASPGPPGGPPPTCCLATAAAAAPAASPARGRRRIDAGRVTCSVPRGGQMVRHFVNVADTGIGGEVLTRVNGGFRVVNGEITYALAAAITLLRWRNRPMHVVIDGEARDVVAQQV